jgi:hypothetical protein
LVDLGPEFTHEFLIADLLVGQPLPGVGFFGLDGAVRGGQLRTHARQLGAVLAGLGLPVLDLPPRGGQLGGQLLELSGGPGRVLLGGLGPPALYLHCLPLVG